MLRLLSFCFAKKKVTKKKAIFGQTLRCPKNSSTLLRKASIIHMALQFCLSLLLLS